MKSGGRGLGSMILVGFVLAAGGCLAALKYQSLEQADAEAALQQEQAEAVSAVRASERVYRPTVTAIGTVLALRSVTLRNELPGTVRAVHLDPGQVVDAGDVLVSLDASVERAELAALQARAELTEAMLGRVQNLRQRQAISEDELDRARADRNVALADIARLEAVIEKKTIRAPFRAKVGLADVHPGQYLNEGTVLTTLQGVDAGVHVDFAVEQRVAAGLHEGDSVDVVAPERHGATFAARIVGIDARIDPVTRNATVRARLDAGGAAPRPGASVRVMVPAGEPQTAVAVPASALRRAPAGDHVFVLREDDAGDLRANQRFVQVVAQLGDEVVLQSGLEPGETVAATGSFKLREAALVTPTGNLLAAGGR